MMEETTEAKPKKAKVKKPNLVDEILAGFKDNDAEELYFVRQPWTFVLAIFEVRGHGMCEYGFSKVCWPDKWNEGVGKRIAVRHAAETLAKKIVVYPEGLDSQVWWIGYYPQGPLPDFSRLPPAPEA